MKYDIRRNITEVLGDIPGEKSIQESLIWDVHYHKERLFLIPTWGKKLSVFDLSEKRFTTINIPNPKEKCGLFLGGVTRDEYLYLIPFYYGGFVKVNMDTLETEKIIKCDTALIAADIDQSQGLNCFTVLSGDTILATFSGTNKVMVFDLNTEYVNVLSIGNNDDQYSVIAHMGNNVFIGGYKSKSIVQYDWQNKKIVARFTSGIGSEYPRDIDEEHILLENIDTGQFIMIDADKNELCSRRKVSDETDSWHYNYKRVVPKMTDEGVFISDTVTCRWYEFANGEIKELPIKLPSDIDSLDFRWSNEENRYNELSCVYSLPEFMKILGPSANANNAIKHFGVGEAIARVILGE